ncbi:MAG TPA: hypothetical protein VK570_04520 [Rubrivivax sp.]|jgi:hypothetical protein|nr:hypothetical protein [Rubrivivax sp.]
MLRAALATLLVANLVFFAWSQGWLAPVLPGPQQADREPQRLAAQFRPEMVRVLPAPVASAAVTAARDAAAVCLEAGPFSSAPDSSEAAAAEAALGQAQLPAGSWLRLPVAVPPPWLVYAGRLPDPAVRAARVEELRRRGLEFEMIEAPPDLAPGLVLSRHADRAAAEAALAALVAPAASQPLRNLRVIQLAEPPAPRHWLRVPRASGEQQGRLASLPPAAQAALGGGFRPCAARP